MGKVKVLLLGLGNFGRSWAMSILPACGEFAEVVGIVDRDMDKWQGIDESIPKYQELDKALDEQKPELVINVTPPYLHCGINEMLLRKGVGVLCEKPLADSLENAKSMRKVIEETNGFLMISQNYRYHPIFRKAKEVLESNLLGDIHHIRCHFSHYHPDASASYHGKLAHPILSDVTIHHMDTARFLSGKDPVKVWCREDAAEYCWYGKRPATVTLVTEMSGNILFLYDGTLAAPVSITDWNADWDIECENGILQIRPERIIVHKAAGEEGEAIVEEIKVNGTEADSRIASLREACMAIREGRKGETDYEDNLKTFEWMERAIEAAGIQNWVTI